MFSQLNQYPSQIQARLPLFPSSTEELLFAFRDEVCQVPPKGLTRIGDHAFSALPILTAILGFLFCRCRHQRDYFKWTPPLEWV